MTEEDKKALLEAITWFRWGMHGNGFVGFPAHKCARTIQAIEAALRIVGNISWAPTTASPSREAPMSYKIQPGTDTK
jgi:hypothetical protein